MAKSGNNSVTLNKGPDPLVAARIIGRVIQFLKLLITDTLAKRIVSTILLSVGTPDARVTELTGLCDRSVRELRKSIKDGELGDDLFSVSGGGRKGKMKDIEELIIEKVDNNSYHTHQEIADMVYADHGIKVHRTAVGRLLKKTKSGA